MGLLKVLKGYVRDMRHPDDVAPYRSCFAAGEKVIVSLTSYPARIEKVHETVRCLLDQTFRADELVLWLAYEEFPEREKDLPKKLLRMQEEGLVIRWCENLGPHKKYYQTMFENPEAIVVTFDDDIHYDKEAVSILYDAHLRHKDAVCARRARFIRRTADGFVAPYLDWDLCDVAGRPSDDLIATGVGGVLYPPHSMDEALFDRRAIKEVCPRADDLWLKTMQMLKGTPTMLADTAFELNAVEGTQEVSLYLTNQFQGKNDEALGRIRDYLAQVGIDVW